MPGGSEDGGQEVWSCPVIIDNLNNGRQVDVYSSPSGSNLMYTQAPMKDWKVKKMFKFSG